MSDAATLTPAQKRKLRSLVIEVDAMRGESASLTETYQTRISERRQIERRLPKLEEELAAARRAVGMSAEGSGPHEEATRWRDQTERAVADLRGRLELVSGEIEQLKARLDALRADRRAMGNFVEAIIAAVGHAGAQIKDELAGVA